MLLNDIKAPILFLFSNGTVSFPHPTARSNEEQLEVSREEGKTLLVASESKSAFEI